MLQSLCTLLSIRGRGLRIFPHGSVPATAWPGSLKLEGFCTGPTMMASDTDHDSVAECQRDICWPSVTSGEAPFLPGRHQWDHPTALAVLTDSLGEIPTPAQGLSLEGLGSYLSQKQSYKPLPPSVTCRELTRHFCSL